MDFTVHAAFSTFVICAALLVLKMIGVGHVVGITRIRRQAILNPEDVVAFRTSREARSDEHPDIARGLRAHRNDLESTLPFLAIGVPYLMTNPPAPLASGLFVAFTVFRFAFSIFYLKAIQPWRSLSFMAGELCVLVMLVQMLWWGFSR